MFALAVIGFTALVLLAGYTTLAAVCLVLSEMVFGGVTVLGAALSAVAVALWALAYWLSPFTVTVGVQV